ncbi:MAG: EAL domain-containing protein [Gammaproteobacteria bacterium]
MRKLVGLLLFCITAAYASAHELVDRPGQQIRVGVWQNPPVVLQGPDGEWTGISIDILKRIARQKDWQLVFVPGTFAEHLQNLQDHNVDLLSAIAYSSKRAELYDYTHTPIISNWALIYTRTDARIASLLELDRRKVAVMRNNIHARAFHELVKTFEINPSLVEVDNFSDVMLSVQRGQADAGVVNRLYGAVNAEQYGLVETGIIFNPINMHYASPRNQHGAILRAIDLSLGDFKADKNSIYYTSLQHWMGGTTPRPLPAWLPWLVGGLLGSILLMMGLTLLLRRQVANRTRELQIEVDERRMAQQRLDRLAHYDALTGLPNRLSFDESLRTAIATARRRNTRAAILFIDIDQFKTVNDSLGHDAGDQLILHIAHRLKDCLRDGDSLNRFGGDEFVAILQDIQALSDINPVVERMLNSLSAPITIAGEQIYSSASIGIALFPDDGQECDGLLKNADTAMYQAKAQGGNHYEFYNEAFTHKVRARLDLQTRLRHALERNELCLHYQPIFNLDTQIPVGVEALLRWQDPQRGLVMPDEFIPFAEETGLIVPMGEWVIEQACTQVKSWAQQGLGPLYLSVNVSSRQFDHNKLLPVIQAALSRCGLAPQQLVLEITERMFLNITDAVRDTLNHIKAAGLGLSIDDFGTGYSSLSYLKQLPIDTLKIDRSFVTNIPDDKDDAQIATTIIAMAHNLGLKVVAEGIETQQQLEALNSWGCRSGQGYYLARPQPVAALTVWLKERRGGQAD